ncbi:hypothetical protein ACFS07_25365 [Undibacterium arcticum]
MIAYWMIPKTLEHALVSPTEEFLKFVLIFINGLILPASLSRANKVIQLFFLGNFAGMMAIVGMLYQEAPQRLCNYYLLDDQAFTGTGLVTWSIILPLLWCWRYFVAVRDGDAAPFFSRKIKAACHDKLSSAARRDSIRQLGNWAFYGERPPG